MANLPGKAIQDFFLKKSKAKLFVHDTFGPKVEMPLSIYFREFSKMPKIEKKALELCKAKTLDIGAGAGSHALELQKRNIEVCANEISSSACDVMTKRGVKNIICEDIFNLKEEKFDTLLLLMNGIGLCGDLEGLKKFLIKAEELLNKNGQLIFDSCDISYMYEDIEKPHQHYFGEVKSRYEYQKELTDWFSWLYLDQIKLKEISNEFGWNSEIVFEDENDQYLAILTKV